MDNIQEFYWGEVRWIEELNYNINIGISKIFPHTYQKPHVHYENEQFLFVLKGRGVYERNGESFRLKAGDYLHFPFNSQHATLNESDEELVDLVISVPRIIEKKEMEPSFLKKSDDFSLLKYATDQILINFDKELSLNFYVVDNNNSIVYSNYSDYYDLDYSEICLDEDDLVNQKTIKKPSYIVFPISVVDKNCGYIIFNHLDIDYDNIPESTKKSIQNYFISLSESISSLISRYSINKELMKKMDELQENKIEIKQIEHQLDLEKEKSSSMKVNYHFMFNTLNYIANLALSQKNLMLYDIIILFSDMVRYTSDNSNDLIPIYQELEYLKTYIQLQKYRYENNLEVQYQIDNKLLNERIPINCIQPIIENAFSHGFINYNGKKKILIAIKEYKKDNINLQVVNNGKSIDMSSLKLINEGLTNLDDKGLSLVYQKFKINFSNHFTMNVFSDNDITGVSIVFPKGVKDD
ncbi:histidine kinase [Facklamia hominis]|uniref:Cupin 2 conserved barrel domain-containing protein n=1 Tax=Facklamia hominis CCUG 36813 TaxID=883111 RepID=K1LH76_9LACT|nr:histidine kinase [Facklamia hominis]EKB53976.1 hypothetical protein HMPREF9706_01412 [Facklamia hominis CCUG 36813]